MSISAVASGRLTPSTKSGERTVTVQTAVITRAMMTRVKSTRLMQRYGEPEAR